MGVRTDHVPYLINDLPDNSKRRHGSRNSKGLSNLSQEVCVWGMGVRIDPVPYFYK